MASKNKRIDDLHSKLNIKKEDVKIYYANGSSNFNKKNWSLEDTKIVKVTVNDIEVDKTKYQDQQIKWKSA